jgi:hypothetical protein
MNLPFDVLTNEGELLDFLKAPSVPGYDGGLSCRFRLKLL